MGDELTLRLPKAEDIPADSPLGEKAERIRSFPRLKVIEIIATEGLGRFSLTPANRCPRSRLLSLEPFQDGLEQPAKINTLLVAGTDAFHPSHQRKCLPALCTRRWKTWACPLGMSN